MAAKVGIEKGHHGQADYVSTQQAAKAERTASRFQDPEVSAEMRALAEAYRSQAEILKKEKRLERKGELRRRARTSRPLHAPLFARQRRDPNCDNDVIGEPIRGSDRKTAAEIKKHRQDNYSAVYYCLQNSRAIIN
jgi:hypothetical protein